MYTVNNKTFKSYLKAIAEADKTGAIVTEAKTGIVRWEPAPKVPNAKMQDYNNRLNAYKAQEAN